MDSNTVVSGLNRIITPSRHVASVRTTIGSSAQGAYVQNGKYHGDYFEYLLGKTHTKKTQTEHNEFTLHNFKSKDALCMMKRIMKRIMKL